MKKITALLLSLLLALSLLCACGDASDGSDASQPAEPITIRIAGMKGPTSIGLVNVMEDNSNGKSANKYEFTLAGTADEITPKLIKGELDIAAVPANLASVLYNKTNGEIQLLAVNTLGVLYAVTTDESVTALEDLRGRTVYTTGKGTTPEYTLRYILSENGIDPDNDVDIVFKSEATEVVSFLASEENAIAILPQPYVTVASSKVSGLKTVIDLNEEWSKIDNTGAIITGVLVVRKAFATEHPEEIKAFLSEYEESIKTVNKDAAKAAQLVAKHGIFENAAVIEKAIPKCNLTFISGGEMSQPVGKYLGVLYAQNAKSVGGKLPELDFYYVP